MPVRVLIATPAILHNFIAVISLQRFLRQSGVQTVYTRSNLTILPALFPKLLWGRDQEVIDKHRQKIFRSNYLLENAREIPRPIKRTPVTLCSILEKPVLPIIFSVRLEAKSARKRHQMVPVVIKVIPRIRNERTA